MKTHYLDSTDVYTTESTQMSTHYLDLYLHHRVYTDVYTELKTHYLDTTDVYTTESTQMSSPSGRRIT